MSEIEVLALNTNSLANILEKRKPIFFFVLFFSKTFLRFGRDRYRNGKMVFFLSTNPEIGWSAY